MTDIAQHEMQQKLERAEAALREESERLDWLLRHTSLERFCRHFSLDPALIWRDAIDAARRKEDGK